MLVTRYEKNFNIVLELVTRDFQTKQNYRVANLKIEKLYKIFKVTDSN